MLIKNKKTLCAIDGNNTTSRKGSNLDPPKKKQQALSSFQIYQLVYRNTELEKNNK